MSNILTPEAILSYPNLFVARKAPGSDTAKYSASIVFEAGTDTSALQQAVIDAAEERFGAKAKDMLKSGELRSPFRTDGEEKGYPAGSIYINASSKNPIGVVDRFKDPATGKARVIDDPAEIYAGCKIRAAVNFYAYDVNGNRGVAAGLNAVQKMADGERLDGRKKAEDLFDALDGGVAAFSGSMFD